MRPLVIVITCAVLASATAARAESLSAADREVLLENLEKLRESASSKLDARYRLAMGRYSAAMASDKDAYELYLECIELVNFKNQGKKTSDFLEWKSKEHDKMAEPGFKLALQYQLRWLVLSLQATSEKANRTTLTAEAQGLVDSIFMTGDKLAGQEQVLNQPATGSIFAKAYDIGHLDNQQWPMSPVQLDDFYEKLVFPPLRTPAKVEALRAAWIKRIQQETIKTETWGAKGKDKGNDNGKGKGERRIGMASEINKNAEYERFLAEILPELQWQMEVDLFSNGDESGAAVRMLAHIEKYAAHKSARKWGDALNKLLTPKPTEAPATAPPTFLE